MPCTQDLTHVLVCHTLLLSYTPPKNTSPFYLPFWESQKVDQTGLKVVILLPQPPKLAGIQSRNHRLWFCVFMGHCFEATLIYIVRYQKGSRGHLDYFKWEMTCRRLSQNHGRSPTVAPWPCRNLYPRQEGGSGPRVWGYQKKLKGRGKREIFWILHSPTC